MVKHPQKTRLMSVCFLLLVLLTIDTMVSSPALADIGPQPVLPGGSSIKPGEETPIQMASEIVVMNVRTATEADNEIVKLNPNIYSGFMQPSWHKAVAEVEADFVMKNPTDQPVNMTVWFPLASALENASWSSNRSGEFAPRIESFQVSVGGTSLEYAVSKLPNP